MNTVIPLKKRLIDIPILIFFFINIIFITYLVDIEQIIIGNTANFTYPLWPPPFMVDLIHWWGKTYDPLLLARPPFWKATIWIDALLFGPFYIFAIYAYIKGKEWIRMPSIIYASVMMTNVTLIMSEELFGVHGSGDIGMVVFANAAWFLFPVLIIYRMWRYPHPFTASENGSE